MRLEEIRSNTNGAPRAPDEAPATVGEIDHAQRFLSNGPSVPIRAPSRFGRLGIFTRRAVYRLLRPYLVRQRELEDALVASLRGLDKRIAEVETRSYEREMTSTHLLASASEQLDRASRTAAETTIRLEHAADDVRAEVADAHSRAAAAQGQAELLDRKLHDRVFVSSPEELAVTDAQGRPAIGYRGGSGGDVYVGFENVFRGSETLIRDRQRFYVDVVREHAPVLDVGSGRGEFLDELADANIAARGIDIDPAMVQRARGKGHDVELADAIAYLEGLADDSLGTVFAAQVVEHLSYDDLVAFLRLAHAKLRSDGLLVFETVNPYSVGALRAFWVDLTHKLPIYPEVALVLCRLVGFDEAVVVFPNGTGELERDRRDEGEYAVVARRGGDDG
jgi:2-polyprenyl-3-methyl-5-hydroxy-6-metoxy-1,4-benzoquinol methylase